MSTIEIDGSLGEGGGQILRTGVALSAITGKGTRFFNIRAGRSKPGLRMQHLTAVKAAARICNARITGAKVGSMELLFEPGEIRGGDYEFCISTAGSACLVFQTVLYPLLFASVPSRIRFEGGTHNSKSPNFHFLERSFLPLLLRMGAKVELTLERFGFFPRGGGVFFATIYPTTELEGLELMDTPTITQKRAIALLSRLPRHIGERELTVVAKELGLQKNQMEIQEVNSPGPGNVLMLEIKRGFAITKMVTGFGERGIRAEDVARKASREMKKYVDSSIPVGEYLTDQLLLPMALGQGGEFRTSTLSMHTKTNMQTISNFLDIRFECFEEQGTVVVRVSKNTP